MHEHHRQAHRERRVLPGHERADGEAERGAARRRERERAHQRRRGGAQPAPPLEREAEGAGVRGVEGQLGDELGEEVLGAAVPAVRGGA